MSSRTLPQAPLLICVISGIFFGGCLWLPQSSATSSSQNDRGEDRREPCDYFDTVNVTDDTSFTNGSVLHGDVLIPANLIGIYDYIYKDLENRIEVTPHKRGCICKLKPCINFCCPWGTRKNHTLGVCAKTTEEQRWPTPTLNVTLANNSLRTVNIFEHFAVRHFRPCPLMFALQPEVETYMDRWKLFENGDMLREDDDAYINRNEFCFVPTVANVNDTVYIINPANCQHTSEFSVMKIVNAYAMLFSIPFMILTIVVYLTIPELRNQHGKSLVCYLLGLIIGYSMLSCISFLKDLDANHVSCKIIGYTAYYFFMAAFFWLSVISFDLWHNFCSSRGVHGLLEKKRFVVYSAYAWGLAAIFLVFTWTVQEQTSVEEYYKPGIGGGEFCWLDMRTWSAMIYFFGPILLIIMANIVMFIMTAMKIHKMQREVARIMAREDNTRNLQTEKDNFALFLRLFIVMGVTWSLEILSYFVGTDSKVARIFYISDICNAIQGFLIFMLFVMKKRVKQLVNNRFFSRKSKGTSATNSTNSTNSSELNPYPNKYAMEVRAQSDVI